MKWVIRGFAVVFVLVIALVAYAFISLDRLVVEGVNRMGPQVTGTRVQLESSALKPWNGAGQLSGLHIGNPDGFGDEDLFSLGEVELDLDLATLREEVLVIDLVRIDSPQLLYLNDGQTDNLRALLSQIEARTGGGGESSESGGAGKKIIIEEFVFSGGRAQASHALFGDQRVTVPLPELRLTGIGRETNGATLKQAAEQIFEQLNQALRRSINQSDLYEQAMAAAEARLQEELQQVEEVRQQLRDAENDARQQIDDAEEQVREVENQLRGVLDGLGR